jgi:hypothetical protein
VTSSAKKDLTNTLLILLNPSLPFPPSLPPSLAHPRAPTLPSYHLHPLQLEDVLTCDKERMKSTRTGSVHQVLVGRASLTESSIGYPQIRKEQVGGREGGREGGEGGREGGRAGRADGRH